MYAGGQTASQPNGPTCRGDNQIPRTSGYTIAARAVSDRRGGLDHASEPQTHSKRSNTTSYTLFTAEHLSQLTCKVDHHLTTNRPPPNPLLANTLTATTNRNTPPRQQQTTSQTDQHVALHEQVARGEVGTNIPIHWSELLAHSFIGKHGAKTTRSASSQSQ